MKKLVNITIVLILSSVTLFSQNKLTAKADAYFKRMSYVKAADAYEKLADKKASKHILEQLGDSYYYNVKMDKAAVAYKRLFNKFSSDVAPEYMFKYAQALRGEGDYKASDEWMKKFHQAKKEDSRGESFVNNQAKRDELNKDPLYKVENIRQLNSNLSDFGTTFYKEGILFTSSKREKRSVKRVYAWNKQPFLDIFYAGLDSVNNFHEIERFSKKINTKFHESSVSFSPDFKIMYFTRNNYNNGKYRKDKKGVNNLKIYRAEKAANGSWENIKELPFNSDEYSIGNPSVSKDGKRLYFTSDMPGSIGETDIFYVTIHDDNTYGNPVNLGKNINTEGREMFPYISEDNVLYFSTDGRFGLGALDVFSSKLTITGFEEPKNLKAPVNSELDDFAFIINPETKKGYLSSNRKGGLGDDDIYSVTQLKEKVIIPPCFMQKQGIVVDSKTQQILPESKVILSKNNIKLDSTIVGADARFSFKVSCDSTYAVNATKQYYLPTIKTFVAVKSKEDEDLKLPLDLRQDFTHTANDQICIKIKPIYFDYNKANIRPDAAVELDHIVDVMNKYPKLKIVAGSHTDARGRASYNEKLSERRAQSTVRYIISKGISPDRITGKGYGETQLVNDCVDNDNHTVRKKCTKEQHQANRRTEFICVKKE